MKRFPINLQMTKLKALVARGEIQRTVVEKEWRGALHHAALRPLSTNVKAVDVLISGITLCDLYIQKVYLLKSDKSNFSRLLFRHLELKHFFYFLFYSGGKYIMYPNQTNDQ